MINFMQIAAGFGLHTCDLNAEEDAPRGVAGMRFLALARR